MNLHRRSLLRAFLAAPVAVRLAPFVRPAPLEPLCSFALTPELLLAFPWRWDWTRWRVAAPPFLVSPDTHAALTEGTPLPPEPTEFYEGDFFLNREGGNGS